MPSFCLVVSAESQELAHLSPEGAVVGEGHVGVVVAGQSLKADDPKNIKNPSLLWMIGFLFTVSFLGLFSVVPFQKGSYRTYKIKVRCLAAAQKFSYTLRRSSNTKRSTTT